MPLPVISSGGSGDVADWDALFKLNPGLEKAEVVDDVRDTLAGKTANSQPFPHVILPSLLANEQILDSLREELGRARWTHTSNDLYSLHRTPDLVNLDVTVFPALRAFRRFLTTTMRDYLIRTTGVELNNRVDVAGSRYDLTDNLLPHDDRNDGRKFAFILYLTPGWQPEWGGLLKLYDADVDSYPTQVAKTVTPQAGQLLFFNIDHTSGHSSWHSVTEVVEPGKSRLSLNGWFHVEDTGVSRVLKPLPPLPRIVPTLDVDYKDVRDWINPQFIAPQNQKQIKRKFAAKSELILPSFLNESKYKEAVAELKKSKFLNEGPVNTKNVGRLDESSLAPDSALASLLRLVRSEAMTLLITQWTGLHLYDVKSVAAAPESSDGTPPAKKPRPSETKPAEGEATTSTKPKRHVEVISYFNKVSQGSYSLCDDQMAADAAQDGFCFDLHLFFSEKDSWNAEAGGSFRYIVANDPEEVLRVDPAMNSAAFVFREPEVLHFTKYVNQKAGDDSYFVLSCAYFGATSGESDSENSTDEEAAVDEYDDESDAGESEELGAEDMDPLEPDESQPTSDDDQ